MARENRGKSGGIRVIYYYYDETIPCLLMAVFGKNEKANLSKAELNKMAMVVAKLKQNQRRKLQ